MVKDENNICRNATQLELNCQNWFDK